MAKRLRRRKKPDVPMVRESGPKSQAPSPRRTVGVRELRQNLSVYLAEVKQGLAYTVTEHGVEVAILRPMPRTADPIERLIAEGRASPARLSPRDLPRPLDIKLEKPLSQILQEMRDEERY